MLTKVYGDFFRLSEDLDFSYDIRKATTRNERSEISKIIKKRYHRLADEIESISISSDLQGSDQSRQYNGEMVYESVLTNDPGRIKFEVSLREKMIDKLFIFNAKTLILNPFNGKELVAHYPVVCFSKKEAYAEKMRAAFCRQQPAIRDYYDIAYALDKKIIFLEDVDFIEAVRAKIKIQENNFTPLTEHRIQLLRNQMSTELFPTLKDADYNNFDLEKVVMKLQHFSESFIDVDVTETV